MTFSIAWRVYIIISFIHGYRETVDPAMSLSSASTVPSAAHGPLHVCLIIKIYPKDNLSLRCATIRRHMVLNEVFIYLFHFILHVGRQWTWPSQYVGPHRAPAALVAAHKYCMFAGLLKFIPKIICRCYAQPFSGERY